MQSRLDSVSGPVASVTALQYVPEVVEQHAEIAASLWVIRDHAVGRSSFRLGDLSRLDERIEANIDGLRIAEASGWLASLDALAEGGAGEFFVAGLLAVGSGVHGRIDQVVEQAFASVAKAVSDPYHPAYDPWRGLVSALAWADREHAVAAIDRLLDMPRPRTRWLGVAAMGARRAVRCPGLPAVLSDQEPLVRARAARTAGVLGRSDLRAALNALLTDPDEDCRFWAAWSAGRLGTTEGMRVLAELAQSSGRWGDRALEILLRRLTIERAHAFVRPLIREPARRRAVIQAAGWIGDALYVAWLIDQTNEPAVARVAGEAFAAITGADIADLRSVQPPDQQMQPNDDPDDGSVALDPDEGLDWPDPARLSNWWEANKSRFSMGTSYFLGTPKQVASWIDIIYRAEQRHRGTAALELSLQRPTGAMFEIRARGDLQRRLIARAGAVI